MNNTLKRNSQGRFFSSNKKTIIMRVTQEEQFLIKKHRVETGETPLAIQDQSNKQPCYFCKKIDQEGTVIVHITCLNEFLPLNN